VKTLGERGRLGWVARIPRAEARLLAIEDVKSRVVCRRYVGGFAVDARGDDERLSDLEVRSSDTAAEAGTAFSGEISPFELSLDNAIGYSTGNLSSSESL
jgi:hypothetical protein